MTTHIGATTTLPNGLPMPWLGLGTWQAADGSEVELAVQAALEIGYRGIDTATIYKNEVGVGRAVAASSIPREEIFLTTKVWNDDQGFDNTLRAFEASRKRLGLDYIDLYLVHWPVQGQFHDTWRALEKLYRDNRVRAIGVSNFLIHHLDDLLATAEIVPMVNQVEFHPHLLQPELLAFCRERRIQIEGWAPLMRGGIFEIAEIGQLAKKHGKTPAQIVLRWNLQHEVVVIPKSTSLDRLRENADLFNFELAPEDMAVLDGLDQRRRIGPDPDNFSF